VLLLQAVEKSTFDAVSFVTDKQLLHSESGLRVEIESSSRSARHALEAQVNELKGALADSDRKRVADGVSVEGLKSAVEQLTSQLGQQWEAQQGKLEALQGQLDSRLADAEAAAAADAASRPKALDPAALRMPDGRTLQEAVAGLDALCRKGGLPLSEADDRRLRDNQVMAARHQKDIDALYKECELARGGGAALESVEHSLAALKSGLHSINEKMGECWWWWWWWCTFFSPLPSWEKERVRL
jgi:hypothetical protein